MAYVLNDIVLESFSMEDFTFTYFLTGNPDPTDIVGKAVTLVAGTRGAVRLSAADDPVDGRIYQYEDRTQQGGGIVVSVERKFRKRLPRGANVIAIGDTVEGAGAGIVRTGTANRLDNIVIDAPSGADYVVVEKF